MESDFYRVRVDVLIDVAKYREVMTTPDRAMLATTVVHELLDDGLAANDTDGWSVGLGEPVTPAWVAAWRQATGAQ